MFEAFRAHSRLSDGSYASIDDVFAWRMKRRDEMPSWWLAETLKYLYLLFAPPDLLPMDQWVFNTEAHPLPIPDDVVQSRRAKGFAGKRRGVVCPEQ